MKIKMVCLEDGIIAIGFRKITAFVEQLNKETQTYFISTNFHYSPLSLIRGRYGGKLSIEDIDKIAQELINADIIGFSSMTGYAELTRSIISSVKRKSRHPFIIWGGIHPIIHPEDAILSDADAICTGEGEFAFQEFYSLYSNGKDFTSVKNFWFKKNGKTIRNNHRPLMTSEEMGNLPFLKYGGEEKIYKEEEGFIPITISDYLSSQGLAYNTIWSVGCPYHCVYCGNTKFIENDKNYRKIRYPKAQYIVEEVKRVKKNYPHISTIGFNDDNLMSIPFNKLKEFAELWQEEVKIPFIVYGVHPNNVREDKIEILTWAGLNRIRMGIQSSSQRILDFYKRNTPISRIEGAAKIISKFSKYQIPPCYDIIIDNPIETKEDVIDTLELIYRLSRPFTLLIYSLRIIPHTELERLMKEKGIELKGIDSYYFRLEPTLNTILLYLLTFYRPPRWLFECRDSDH